MRKRTFDFQDDEMESESYCLSNNSQTESLHSGRLSDLSSKKDEKNNTKLHSKKSYSSDTMKKDSNRRPDHHLYTFRQQQQSVTLANIITIVILLLMIIVAFMLLSIGSKVKSGAILKDETGSSSAFTSHPRISGKYPDEIKRTITTVSENYDSKLSSLPFLLESRDNVYKSFLIVQPEEVKCYAWISFLTLKISTFWKACNNPKQLFSNSNLLSPSYKPLARADSVTRKKWIFKAETVSFDIQLLDATRIQGIAIHLEEFQIQYYLRNDLWLQLYGHYHKSDHNIYGHSSGNRNSILLFDEKFTTQNLVKDTTGKALMILFLCNNHYNQEQISSLSLKLRAKSTILHQIISIEVLESKTYNKK